MRFWNVAIIGPADSSYSGAELILEIDFPNEILLTIPKIYIKKFDRHIIKELTIKKIWYSWAVMTKDFGWSPAMKVKTMIEGVLKFLEDPSREEDSLKRITDSISKENPVFSKEASELTIEHQVEELK